MNDIKTQLRSFASEQLNKANFLTIAADIVEASEAEVVQKNTSLAQKDSQISLLNAENDALKAENADLKSKLPPEPEPIPE